MRSKQPNIMWPECASTNLTLNRARQRRKPVTRDKPWLLLNLDPSDPSTE